MPKIYDNLITLLYYLYGKLYVTVTNKQTSEHTISTEKHYLHVVKNLSVCLKKTLASTALQLFLNRRFFTQGFVQNNCTISFKLILFLHFVFHFSRLCFALNSVRFRWSLLIIICKYLSSVSHEENTEFDRFPAGLFI